MYKNVLGLYWIVWWAMLCRNSGLSICHWHFNGQDQSPQPTQNFWVYSEILSFSFYIAEFWHTFWVIWENGSNWSNLRLKMSFVALGGLKNHKVPHLHPNSTMFMPLDRLQLMIWVNCYCWGNSSILEGRFSKFECFQQLFGMKSHCMP